LGQLFHAGKNTQKTNRVRRQNQPPFLKPNNLSNRNLQLFRKHPLIGQNR
jgi:hypothetical protein